MGRLADCWRVDPDEMLIRLFERVENEKDKLSEGGLVYVASVGKGQVLFAQVSRAKTPCCCCGCVSHKVIAYTDSVL